MDVMTRAVDLLNRRDSGVRACDLANRAALPPSLSPSLKLSSPSLASPSSPLPPVRNPLTLTPSCIPPPFPSEDP
eukprot:CAMPEP_0202418002 /NCGR_PEP_ID=MMETSP1128-20130828/44792_1 /ASSEMBLY_ACC=CAM_ASM_000463 /TAXON_ID=3047 /ORGANISM="Dunaliella tertiolecta, Strain CCMP1320" /LENGTH=74 /DNA_ID=CAMNT_0049025493 /DNA_START=334 /DNA_END=554 /DNA_ORIENTATION=-